VYKYTSNVLYSNFRSPLFSQTCQPCEIREIKREKKNRFYSNMRNLQFLLSLWVHEKCLMNSDNWNMVESDMEIEMYKTGEISAL